VSGAVVLRRSRYRSAATAAAGPGRWAVERIHSSPSTEGPVLVRVFEPNGGSRVEMIRREGDAGPPAEQPRRPAEPPSLSEASRNGAVEKVGAEPPRETSPWGSTSDRQRRREGSHLGEMQEPDGEPNTGGQQRVLVFGSWAGASKSADEPPSRPASPAPSRVARRCAIVFQRSGPIAEFHVVPVGPDGRDGPPVAWSRSFPVPPSGVAADDDQRRSLPDAVVGVHEDLVKQLAYVGWRREGSRGAWYETVFVRDAGEELDVERCAVACPRNRRHAHFEARQFDDYGNEKVLASSPPLSLSWWRRDVPSTTEARLLHSTLMRYLEREGWEAADGPEKQWYAATLVRRR
jgi:hypothetical protein